MRPASVRVRVLCVGVAGASVALAAPRGALAEEPEEAEGELREVTGSAIARPERTTAAPVTVLHRRDLEAAGLSTLGDILQDLPAHSNAINAQLNNGGDGSTRINLRGLGASRTLVLLDGRRVVPGGLGADASVDLNAIPLAVIERVEVLKDGASAIHGGGAIGGVVNLVTRKDVSGSEVQLYTGGSRYGDGLAYDMSFVTGHSSNKGNVMFSAGFQSQRPVFGGARGGQDQGLGTPGGSSATPGGSINARSIDVDGDGVLDGVDLCGPRTMFPICRPDGMGGYVPFVAPDDLYEFEPENYLYTPSRRYNAYGAGHYQLTKHTRVFFEGLYLNRQSDQRLAPEPFLAAVPISALSVYNNTGGDVYDYRRRLEELGPRRRVQNVDMFQIVTGVGGKLPAGAPALPGWRWELSYSYGHTAGLERSEGNLNLSRLAAALGPSFLDGNGVARCGTPGNAIPGCVPVNIMGPSGSITSEQAAYVTFTGVGTGFNDQKTLLAQASGRIAKLPNRGAISAAVGADYRREAGGFTPDPLTLAGDTTGTARAPTAGSYGVAEAFGELSIVPVSGLAGARWVELDLAGRAFHYDSFGGGVTGRIGALIETFGGVSLRGGYASAFRAPSVGELYQRGADRASPVGDPCDTAAGPLSDPVAIRRCAEQGVPTDAVLGTAQQRSIAGGDPALEAETARVFTAGLVYEPPRVKGLSLAVDYFDLEIARAIQALGAPLILRNCYERDLSADCARIHRDPQRGFAIDFIDDSLQNVGGVETEGVDFAIAYRYEAGSAGRFHHALGGQYLRSFVLDKDAERLSGVGVYDLGVYPRWRASYAASWERRRFAAGVNVRYIHGFQECQDGCNTDEDVAPPSREIDRNVTVDLFGSYTIRSRAGISRITVGVNNLTDQRPPPIVAGFAGGSDASAYDYMGQYFYARLSQAF